MDDHPAIDVAVAAGAWPAEADLRKLAAQVLATGAEEVSLLGGPVEVSLLFTDDGAIADINRIWRQKPNATNVLSFPAAMPSAQKTGPRILGDIVFGYETVAKEAAEAHLTLMDHISHLLVHGLLHLVGFDHEGPAEADRMEALETRILAKLGIADPYADTEPDLIGIAGNI